MVIFGPFRDSDSASLARVTPLFLLRSSSFVLFSVFVVWIRNGMVSCAGPKTSTKVSLFRRGRESVVRV